eukprot:4809886-Ditylum_brightwellii.AAC.1
MKSLLKIAIARADERGYRCTKNVKKKKKNKHKAEKNKKKETSIESPGNVLLSVLLAESEKEANKKNSTDNMLSPKGSDVGSSLYS